MYEGIIVPTVCCGAEMWCMRQDERRRVNVLDLKCLSSMNGVR